MLINPVTTKAPLQLFILATYGKLPEEFTEQGKSHAMNGLND